jgi:hypothetical protein
VTRAHSKCPHCGAPASLFSGSTIERNTHRSDRIGAENQLSAYYTKDGSAVVTTDNELAYSFKRFVQRTIAVIQALILLSALMLAAALSIQAHQEYSYSGVGAYFSSEYSWFSIMIYLSALLISGVLAFVFAGKFRVLPHSEKSMLSVMALHFAIWVSVGSIVEVAFFNPALGGAVVGALLSVGLLTRLVWWLAAFAPNLQAAKWIYALLSTGSVLGISYVSQLSEATEAWPMYALMLPYVVALLFWHSFDVAASRRLKPRRFIKLLDGHLPSAFA